MSKPVHYHYGAFPPSELDWASLVSAIGSANAVVARHDGVLAAMPNADVLLSPLTTQEAVLSSRIEGTQATMGEVLEFEAEASSDDLTENRREDIHEVLNYRRAMRLAEERLTTLPLSLRLIREVHEILLEGVRGDGKAPGEFRKLPNWIGPPGCSIEEAKFVPVTADKLVAAMSDWEKYLHSEQPDRLVQLAIIHAEFESIHPFLDGNGRLGRILIPLFLWQRGLIRKPMFYLSGYLEANRDRYYDQLLAVSRDGDWTGWAAFFLQGVRAQAEDNLNKAQAILDLYEEMKPKVIDWTHSQYAIHALDWIFSKPLFRTTNFVDSAEIPAPTARRLVREFVAQGLLRELSPASGRRSAVLCFPRLLNIAEGEEKF